MAAKPSSSTSLLWAHQLKREHGYLLKRMQDLEAADERQNKRIKSTETAVKSGSNADIIALTKQIKALEDSGLARRVSKLEGTMKAKTEEFEANAAALGGQVQNLQKQSEARDEEKARAFTKEKALLKWIGEVKDELKIYEQRLTAVGRKVDDARLEDVRRQLDGLVEQVEREGGRMKRLEESVKALEGVNGELKRTNGELMVELERVKGGERKNMSAARKSGLSDASQDDEVSEANNMGRKRNWAAGDEDRDIVRSGAQLFGSVAQAMRTNYNVVPDADYDDEDDEAPPTKKTRMAPPKLKAKTKYKPTPPQLRAKQADVYSSPKTTKSHKWAGGGADKDIIRSGQGFPTQDTGAAAAAGSIQTRFPPPSKRNPTPRWTLEEANTQGRTTRRAAKDRAAGNTETGEALTQKVQSRVAPEAKEAVASKPTLKTEVNLGKSVFTSSSSLAQPRVPAKGMQRRRKIEQD